MGDAVVANLFQYLITSEHATRDKSMTKSYYKRCAIEKFFNVMINVFHLLQGLVGLGPRLPFPF